MNKLVTCAGLAAVGAVGLQAQYLGSEAPQKTWSVSARLRGFYDDNYATLPGHRDDGGPTKRGSWGGNAEVFGGYAPKLEQMTTIGITARYDIYYYEDRPRAQADHVVDAGALFSHQFSDRYKVDFTDSFVVAQEPQLLDPAMAATFLRAEGSNIGNTANLVGNAKVTEKLNVNLGLSDRFIDYQQKGDGSWSARLDRLVNSGDLQVRYDWRPNTTAYVGYRFDYTDMTSKDHLWTLGDAQGWWDTLNTPPAGWSAAANTMALNYVGANARPTSNATIPKADIRNNYAHFGYLGVDHQFNAYLSAKVMAGVQMTEYPNARERTVNAAGVTNGSTKRSRDNVVPYADASVRYDYAKDCFAQLQVIHQRYATDVPFIGANTADGLIGALVGEYTTMDQESTTVSALISHAVTPKLRVGVRGQWQGGTFNQKNLSSKQDNFEGVDVMADYEINRYLRAEAGYSFSILSSDLPNRGYQRNRLYAGVRGTY